MEVDSGAHTVHNLYYHIVWVPKYRRRVLEGKVGERARQVIVEVAEQYGYGVDELKVNPDHIDLLVRLEPKYGLPDVVRTLKERQECQRKGETNDFEVKKTDWF